MADGFEPAERRRTALNVVFSATIFAIVCVLLGEELLAVFGIDVPSFRIAGGLILIAIGFRMLNAENRPPGDRTAIQEGRRNTSKSIAVVPLSTPLTIGPGALAVIIVYAHQLSDRAEIATLIPVVLICCFISGLGLYFADHIARLLGTAVISIATRIMAIILLAVSEEMVMTGILDSVDARFPNITQSSNKG